MRRRSVLWGVFVSRFEDALDRFRRRRLNAEEAGELLGVSGRHFRRLCVRFEADGLEGLRDRRLGQPSPRRADPGELSRICGLYRERYRDFSAKHFHETVVREHGYRLGYTVTRLALQAAGLVHKAKARGKHRKKRQRRPLPGMLMFQDGSTHCWLPDSEAQQDLIVTLDDATGHITSIFLAEQEGTMSSLRGLSETIRGHGLFGALYTDRGSHYFLTPDAGGRVDKTKLTQVGRALAQLGIRHIPSYSPEARGRMERAFGTLQGWVPQELRVRGWRRWRRRTRICARCSWRSSTPGSGWRPRRRARRSWPTAGRRWTTRFACRRNAGSGGTTGVLAEQVPADPA